MCGIYGYYSNIEKIKINDFQNINKLFHRGPDGSNSWISQNKNIIFQHARLSIIDLTTKSNQPMIYNDGQLVLVYNGEVYNYIELKEELLKLGHNFKSTGDTEVVLKSYLEWGTECFKKFNGMFALAIFDKKNTNKEKIILARDRLGKKPLYYCYKENLFEFSSETKAMNCEKTIDLKSLDYYLSLGYIPDSKTISKEIKKIKPGHFASLDLNTNKFIEEAYWKLENFNYEKNNNIDFVANKTWEMLKESVSLRLRTDADYGIFLSGGLDSSLITAAAAEVHPNELNTFNVSVEDKNLNEENYALEVSKYFKTKHHIINVKKEDFLNSFEEILNLTDEPLGDSSIIPSYIITKSVSESVKTILSGDGGDELFGGYDHYNKVLSNNNFFSKFPITLIKKISNLYKILPIGFYGRNTLHSLKYGSKKSYLFSNSFFDEDSRNKLINIKKYNSIINENSNSLQDTVNNSLDFKDNMMLFDLFHYLPDDILHKVDRASMMNSIEIRNPFLDYKLVEFYYQKVNINLKISNGGQRYVQKLLAKKFLPKKINLKKQGFSIPINSWINDINTSDYTKYLPDELFNKKIINKIIKSNQKGLLNGQRIFSLIMLANSFKNLKLNIN